MGNPYFYDDIQSIAEVGGYALRCKDVEQASGFLRTLRQLLEECRDNYL